MGALDSSWQGSELRINNLDTPTEGASLAHCNLASIRAWVGQARGRNKPGAAESGEHLSAFRDNNNNNNKNNNNNNNDNNIINTNNNNTNNDNNDNDNNNNNKLRVLAAHPHELGEAPHQPLGLRAPPLKRNVRCS